LSNNNTSLLIDKYPQKELFICDVSDAVLKDIIPQMEHPFYSLSKKPDTSIKRYEHNGNWLEVIPSIKGHATIYDKDILVYCISQIMAKVKQGEEISKVVKINSSDLLKFTNRGTSGRDYQAFYESILRLAGTKITTNIQTGDEEIQETFGLINSASIRKKHGLDGRLLWVKVELSDWVFNAVKAKEVLTLHPDYFRLSKPLEKRVYEIARKHCGQQQSWKIDLSNLLKKTGSQSPLKRFKQLIKNLVEHNHLPDYSLKLEDNMVVFTNKNFQEMEKWYNPDYANSWDLPKLNADTYSKARNVAPELDVYFLEDEWIRFWFKSGKPRLRNPDGAFIEFCRKRGEKKL